MLEHQQVSTCELFSGSLSIWAFKAADPFGYRYWIHGTKLYASPGTVNISTGLLMAGNALPGLTSLVFNCMEIVGGVRVWQKPHESMDPTYQQETVQADGVSVMVRGVCSWRDMRLRYIYRIFWQVTGILSPATPYPLWILTDLGNSSRIMRHPVRRELLQIAYKSTLLTRHSHGLPKSPDTKVIEYIWNA